MPNPAKSLGPGILVTAAFIGPGTVTTASIAGASYGFALLWALLFSILATMVLQEMATRLGLVTRQGLAEALRDVFSRSWLGGVATALVVAAIGFGNAAYEAGNIIGAALGLESILNWPISVSSLLVGTLSGALLASGTYAAIEKLLIALVLIMSIVFLATLVQVGPDPGEMLRGALLPGLPAGSMLTVVALVGTTVVPYNLFLHASAVQERWPAQLETSQALGAARADIGLSVGLGGLITIAVMSTAAAAFFNGDHAFSAASMARQLEPLLGPAARYFFAAGLFAAGLSSAVTAPLAAAYAVCGVLGWSTDLKATRFRLTWLIVLLCGTGFAAAGTKPLTAILFAQAANGFLLPLCAIFLLLVMNRRDRLQEHVNGVASNVAGVAVVLITLALGGLKILQVLRLV
ncbi:MAG: Nramp family divalent metal transporter [Halieaceae bacterium]|jgi:NRAMP (natural resistance-associated macrophage protein)-like metal ion transporter|nr:Nramp family divalent metal transporter [Halieaceae bacterium]